MKVVAVFAALVAVSVAAPLGAWTLADLSEAIQSPSTSPALLPYLEDALNQYMQALWHGQELEGVAVVTPAGILPAPGSVAVIPTPVVIPSPVVPTPTPAVTPETVQPAPAAQSSPLVQIIVNVNAEQQVGASPAPAPAPAVVPEIAEETVVDPVIVVDEAINIDPVTVVDESINVDPVIVVEEAENIELEPIQVAVPILPEPNIPVVLPEPIEIGEPSLPAPANPIDVIAVAAPDANPIDIIAVGAPEVNPIDIISPVPAVAAGSNEGILV